MMRFLAAIVATSLLAANSFAAAAETRTALKPGKPASVKQAQTEGTNIALIAGVAIVAGGIALVAASDNKSNLSATTTATGTGVP